MPLTPAMTARTSQLVEKDARTARPSSRQRSYSDEIITPELSLTVSAVLAAFTILAEDISSLPLILYARRGRNKTRAYDSSYYRLLHDQPNPEHSSMVFREFIMGHLLGWGNFYAQPILDKAGDVQELWPLRPDRMAVSRVEGQRVYTYQTSDGKPRVFLSDEIFHLPAFGFDGLIGYSRIALARNAIGLSMSAEKFGSKFYANGTNVGVIYKHPGELKDIAYDRLQKSLEEKSGVENSHKPMILEEGMSIEKLGIPPDDAQFLETRKFQVSEIARIFRVPPHMIGDVDKSTSWGSGIDSQEQGYVSHTLRPWMVRIEQGLNSQVLLERDRASMFYEHLADGLMRGDVATRYEAYTKAITVGGFMTRNEARERENMNPRKGLDALLQPLNLTTVGDSSDGREATDAGANALRPLWRDAVARVVRREANDLSGASKRYQAKGQQDAFDQWADQFYGVDHPAFMSRQFATLIQAQKDLYDVDCGNALDEHIQNYLSTRRESVRTDVTLNVDETVEEMMKMIMSFDYGDQYIASALDEEEFEYEQ